MGWFGKAKAAVKKAVSKVTSVVKKAKATVSKVVSSIKKNVTAAKTVVAKAPAIVKAVTAISKSPSVTTAPQAVKATVAAAASKVSSAVSKTVDAAKSVIGSAVNQSAYTAQNNLALIDAAAKVYEAGSALNITPSIPFPTEMASEAKKNVEVVDKVVKQVSLSVPTPEVPVPVATQKPEETFAEYLERSLKEDFIPVIKDPEAVPVLDYEASLFNVLSQPQNFSAAEKIYYLLDIMPVASVGSFIGKSSPALITKLLSLSEKFLPKAMHEKLFAKLGAGVAKAVEQELNDAVKKGPTAVAKVSLKWKDLPLFLKVGGVAFIVSTVWNFTDPIWWTDVFHKLTGNEQDKYEKLRIQVSTNLKQVFNLVNYEPTQSDLLQAQNILKSTKPLIVDLVGFLYSRDIFKLVIDKAPEYENEVASFISQFDDLWVLSGGSPAEVISTDKIKANNPPVVVKPIKDLPYSLKGNVVKVYDGGRFMLRVDWDVFDVGLSGFSALSLNSEVPIVAYTARVQRDYLMSFIMNQNVTVYPKSEKTSGGATEFIADVFLVEKSVNQFMKEAEPGSLLVHTKPTYAEVLLSGTSKFSNESIYFLSVGLSGKEIKDIAPGKYSLLVRLVGYEDYIYGSTLTIASKTRTDVPGVLVLQKYGFEEKEQEKVEGKGTVTIKCDPEVNAYIDIDGVYSGEKTPFVFYLLPGSHTFTAYKKGYSTEKKTVVVEAGQTYSKTVTLTEKTPPEEHTTAISISFSSSPSGASIFIDSFYMNKKTPAVLMLEPGSHTVTLKKDGFIDDVYLITVPYSGEGSSDRFLKAITEPELPIILVSSEPSGAAIYINGLPSGKYTPRYFEIQPGEHLVRVEKSGYYPAETTITVKGV